MEDECDWSGQVDLTGAALAGGFNLPPLPLLSAASLPPPPLGQARILHQHGRGSSSERGRRGRRWVVDKSNAPNATIFCPVRYSRRSGEVASAPTDCHVLSRSFPFRHFGVHLRSGEILSRPREGGEKGRGKRKHFRRFPSILISPTWQTSKQRAAPIFRRGFFFSKRWNAKIIFSPSRLLRISFKKGTICFRLLSDYALSFREHDEGINDKKIYRLFPRILLTFRSNDRSLSLGFEWVRSK